MKKLFCRFFGAYSEIVQTKFVEVPRVGFWVFMLIMVLLIPIIMITFGKLFSKKAPKDINYTFGYRTKRSMMNMETWMFAHAYIGKLWFICGLLLFPLSAVVMTFVFGKGPDTVGIAGGILTIVQMIIVIGTILPTENALKKSFDEYGRRR